MFFKIKMMSLFLLTASFFNIHAMNNSSEPLTSRSNQSNQVGKPIDGSSYKFIFRSFDDGNLFDSNIFFEEGSITLEEKIKIYEMKTKEFTADKNLSDKTDAQILIVQIGQIALAIIASLSTIYGAVDSFFSIKILTEAFSRGRWRS